MIYNIGIIDKCMCDYYHIKKIKVLYNIQEFYLNNKGGGINILIIEHVEYLDHLLFN